MLWGCCPGPSGETGRRTGLKIPYPARGVRVRSPPRPFVSAAGASMPPAAFAALGPSARAAGRTSFTASRPSLAPAVLAALRPPAAPPGGRARARCGERRPFSRIFVAAGLCPAVHGTGWQADSADRRSAATPGGLRGVVGSLEPALLAERSRPIRFADRCPLRSEGQHRVSGGQAGTEPPQADWSHSERPGDRDRPPRACAPLASGLSGEMAWASPSRVIDDDRPNGTAASNRRAYFRVETGLIRRGPGRYLLGVASSL